MEKGNPVLEWVQKPIPDQLWHYTSVQGLHGIASSMEIHASDCRFLNDREEIVHARGIAQNLISEYPERDSNGLDLRSVVRYFVDDIFSPDGGMFNPGSLQCFVASFSTKRDSLSQWRAYSYGSTGACLGFKVQRMTESAPQLDFDWLKKRAEEGFPPSFAPCVYAQSQKLELLRFAIGHIISGFQEVWIEFPQLRTSLTTAPADRRFVTYVLKIMNEAMESPEVQTTKIATFWNATVRTIGELLLITALLKNESFIEEDEWRLVLWSNVAGQASKLIPRFRVSSNTLTPFVAFPLQEESQMRIDFENAILGPGSDLHAVSACLQFLRTIGINISPSFSSIPYKAK